MIGNSLKAIRGMRNTLIESNTKGENQAKGKGNDNTHKSAHGNVKRESKYNVPKLVPTPSEGLVGKSNLKKEKKYNIPNLVPGEGFFRKSNAKKDDIPLFRKSNVKKEEKDDVPKFDAGKGFNTSIKKEKKKPKISSDEIIVLSSDEEYDRDEIDLQAVARVSLEGHRAGFNVKNESKEIIEMLSSDEEDDNNEADVQVTRRISLGAVLSTKKDSKYMIEGSTKRVIDLTETKAQAGRHISLEEPGAADPNAN